MKEKIRIAVCGYGNLGRGIERNLGSFPDMECVGIFSRRKDIKSETGLNIYSFSDIMSFKDKIDVLLITLGSFGEALEISPRLAESFNTVDSFDDHVLAEKHLQNMDKAALKGGKTALISCGWDPGIFSLMRLLGKAFIPHGQELTFWGKGVSQGHTQVLKKIPKVIDAKEYTIPNIELIKKAESGQMLSASKEKLHRRECFVVLEDGADEDFVSEEIRNIPDYFKGFETDVHFIDEAEMQEKHSLLSHEGRVFSFGKGESAEFHLKMDSNPDFTGRAMLTFARAVYMMKMGGEIGAKTIFDIRPKWLIMEEANILKFL